MPKFSVRDVLGSPVTAGVDWRAKPNVYSQPEMLNMEMQDAQARGDTQNVSYLTNEMKAGKVQETGKQKPRFSVADVLSEAQAPQAAPQGNLATAVVRAIGDTVNKYSRFKNAAGDAVMGIGAGVGDTALGVQKLIGKGANAIGADAVGNWLVNDANQGQAKLENALAPNKERSPLATGTAQFAGEVLPTLPVGGLMAKGVEALPALAKAAPGLASALRTGGFTTGLPAAPLLSGAGAGAMATRMVGGAFPAAAAQTMIDGGFDNTGKAALIGGFLPPVAAGVGKVGAVAAPYLAKPFQIADELIMPGGKQRAAGRMFNKLAGDKANEVTNALRNAAPGETAGQAIVPTGSAELAALQKFANTQKPSEYVAINDAQELARRNMLEGVTPDLQGAIKARGDVTGPMRQAGLDAANVSGVRSDKIINSVDSTLSAPGTRASDVAQKSLGYVRDKISGLTNKSGVIDARDLYTVRKEIGSVVSQFAKESGNWDKRMVSGIQMDVQKSIDNAIEAAGGAGWKSYLAKFGEMSRPIDQSKVLGEMSSVLAKPGGGERVAPFLNTLGRGEQALLKKSTGFPRYQDGDLSKVLTPRQMGAVGNIENQLTRDTRLDYLAKEGAPAMMKTLRLTQEPSTLPGLLNPKITVVNAILRRLQGNGGEAVNQELARLMMPQNKALLADVISKASPQQYKMLNDAMKRLGPTLYRAAPQIGASR